MEINRLLNLSYKKYWFKSLIKFSHWIWRLHDLEDSRNKGMNLASLEVAINLAILHLNIKGVCYSLHEDSVKLFQSQIWLSYMYLCLWTWLRYHQIVLISSKSTFNNDFLITNIKFTIHAIQDLNKYWSLISIEFITYLHVKNIWYVSVSL